MNTLKLIVIFSLCFSLTYPVFAQESLPACQEDLTGETIQFYHFGDLSGVLAQLSLPVLAGFEDALQHYNDQGGICGATLTMEYRDTGGSQDAAQAAWDDFTSRDDATLMFVYLTEDAELLRNQAEEKQIPIVVSSGSVQALYGENADDPAWVFSVTPIFADQLGAFCAYISENWSQFGMEGEPVLGHVSFVGSFGQSSDTPEARAYCESVGVGYAGAQYYFPGVPDISTEIQTVIDAGANIIYTTSVAFGPSQLANTVVTMGLEGQVLLAGPNIVLDTTTIQLGGESVAGIIGQLPYLWWDETEQSGIQTITESWQSNRFTPADDPETAYNLRNVAYLVAWTAVDLYVELTIETINRVGYENLNGAAMFETMTSGQAYSALDGVITIQYTDTVREPRLSRIGSIQFVETEEGLLPQILPLTDFITVPDLKPNGADVP